MRFGPAITHTQEAALRLDTAMRTAKELTRKQADAIKRVRDRGPEAWCDGLGRTGGAVSRMFERLSSLGLVTKPPYRMTDFGRRVIESYDAMRRQTRKL